LIFMCVCVFICVHIWRPKADLRYNP
jgi:hypothetical protein